MDKKKREKMRSTMKKAQEVVYNREFKSANRAGGFKNKPLL
ncbi:YfhE family protein [Bacillus sp. AGMB 02131]|uniref:YfhE family protein n=1 Tax=Peribacillus faecalis TaxID=2772559 RepID=A0A927CVU6_9BACI|nr:YfhE family protein [Peribacillus faecalis]MBD3108737.1 YfhE family protein [Peribacillus faecalis]